MTDYNVSKTKMVERHLKGRDITDVNVLKAMREVPREKFVGGGMADQAYADSSLPIGSSQTISQPYMVALMIQSLEPEEDDVILDIGTGSGYAAAVASRIVKEVYSIERISSLADRAIKTIDDLGYDNIHIRHGDGTRGWAEHAPYDGIMVAAAAKSVPEALKEQLAIGGNLVIPVESGQFVQNLKLYHKKGEDDFGIEELHPVRFVPLINE